MRWRGGSTGRAQGAAGLGERGAGEGRGTGVAAAEHGKAFEAALYKPRGRDTPRRPQPATALSPTLW